MQLFCLWRGFCFACGIRLLLFLPLGGNKAAWGRTAPAPDVAKAYKNLDELLGQLRSSFYSGPSAQAAAPSGAAAAAKAEAAEPGVSRGAGEEAGGPRPPPPEYEEFDDGIGMLPAQDLFFITRCKRLRKVSNCEDCTSHMTMYLS